MKICIVYHDDADGKCSAAIVAYNHKNDDITFISYDYTNIINEEDLYDYDKLYIVDCALDYKTMNNLFENVYKKNFLWIDHHITAIESQNSSIYGLRLPNNGSACLLTWKYFFKESRVPDAVKYISDFDIWEFKYEKLTKGFNEWLSVQNDSPDNYDMWFSFFEHMHIGSYVDEGMIIYNARIEIIKKDIKKLAYESKIDGKKCLKMNYSSLRSLSDAGNLMLRNGYHISWIWYKIKDGSIYNSLRGDGTYDVSEIAKKFGGGGHKNASGFVQKN